MLIAYIVLFTHSVHSSCFCLEDLRKENQKDVDEIIINCIKSDEIEVVFVQLFNIHPGRIRKHSHRTIVFFYKCQGPRNVI